VVKVSGDPSHPANFGRLCTKGLTCASAIDAPGRLASAFLRPHRNRSLERVDLNVAITHAAARLREIMERYGPDAVALYVSGQMSLEAQYLANKLCKGFLRTNNIDSNSRLCMSSAASGYKQSLGADGPPGSYQDIDHSHCFFIIGSNMADCHPILFLRVLDRCKKANAKLIVVDPRRTATAEKADLHLQVKPGTDLALLNGLLYLLVKNEHIDNAFIARHTEGWKDLAAFLEDYTPHKVAVITGLSQEQIHTAARWIGEAAEWMSLWTMGLNQSTHGAWHTNALCNLHLATGKICRRGSGPFSLTGQPNAMGGREVGYLSHGLPGQRTVLDEADRRFVEALWRIPPGSIKPHPGPDAVSLFRQLAEGTLKAVWIICTNPVASIPNRQQVIDGLKKAELVITQDVFLETETNHYADVILPGALWAETEGVIVNSERSLTLLSQAVPPPGQALPDWRIIAHMATALGYGDAFSYKSAEEIFEEIRQTGNPKTGYDLRGVNYARLRQGPIQWPCPPDGQERHPIRYCQDGDAASLRFPTASGKARFFARPYESPAEPSDNDFSFTLNTGRLPHQWHTLTKTGKIPTLTKLNPAPFLEVHPHDAKQLGLVAADLVTVRSRRGSAVYPVVVTERVRSGECFAPFHWNDLFGENLAINAVTNDATDPASLQPELKYCAVQLERVVTSSAVEPSPSISGSTAFTPSLAASGQPSLTALRTLLGLPESSAVQLTSEEKHYLNGFLTGVQLQPRSHEKHAPMLPEAAPLPTERRLWLNGLLAGIFASCPINVDTPKPQPAARPSSLPSITLLFASQTGNAENLAKQLSQRLTIADFPVRLFCMADYPTAELSTETYLLIITSTYGDGETPDTARAFWSFLKNASALSLPQLKYAVLALGDSHYDQFCQCGKNFDARLSELGAQRLLSRVDCDTDFQAETEQWMSNVCTALLAASKTPTNIVVAASQEAKPPTAALPSAFPYSKSHPFPAPLLVNRRLNGKSSTKETRHYEFSLRDSGLTYEAGDALGVWPTNCPRLVEELLTQQQLNGETLVSVDNVGNLPLREALLQHFEISCISRKSLLAVAERSQDADLKKLLTDEQQGRRKRFLWGRQLIDLLYEFPRVKFSATDLLPLLRRLQPRFYSLSSSPKAHPEQAHLTVRTIRYEYAGRQRYGTSSTFLADRVGKGSAPVFIQRSTSFHLPADLDTPVIMIGPGTGVAPFRAFLHERRLMGAKGANWLFFGEQHEATDFYYHDELLELQRAGVLTRLSVAFSRDQAEKVYVQHRMLEQSAEVWSWLQDGACIYVCGDARYMAKDVDSALRSIIMRHKGVSGEHARAYLEQLLADGRYLRDVYE
jgi:sulfite reductase (NADPH) flavoprotein alpha-component